MVYSVFACILILGAAFGFSEACIPGIIPGFPPNSTSNSFDANQFDTSLESPDYPKAQAFSALMNLLLQIGIDSGIVGGETYPCPMDSTETTFHPDPFDCTHYYKCDQGVSTSLKCEEKEGYDNVTQKCIPSEDVPLCKELPFDPDFKCASSGLHANPKDCQKYYICANGRGYAITCAADNNFDAALRLCVPKAKSLCLPISKQE